MPELQEWKITYKDGATQKVSADKHGVYGDWVVFTAAGKDVLRIAGSQVKSVARADVPDAEVSVYVA
jgi:hypothetical protein